MSLGPVEYVLIEFPGSKFKGEIVPALQELVARRGATGPPAAVRR